LRETQLLGMKHELGLKRLLGHHEPVDPQAERLKRNLPFFLSHNGQALAAGVTLDRDEEVEQALLTFFQRPNANHDYMAVTLAYTLAGSFDPGPFDTLCASCSSASPTVCLHVVICSKGMSPTLKRAWAGSRLGKYTVKARELTNAEALDLLGNGIVELDHTHKVNLYAVQYPSDDGDSLQPKPRGVTIRCKYC
jgi:hypothetical protein